MERGLKVKDVADIYQQGRAYGPVRGSKVQVWHGPCASLLPLPLRFAVGMAFSTFHSSP